MEFRTTEAAEICRAEFQREWNCTGKELQKYVYPLYVYRKILHKSR